MAGSQSIESAKNALCAAGYGVSNWTERERNGKPSLRLRVYRDQGLGAFVASIPIRNGNVDSGDVARLIANAES